MHTRIRLTGQIYTAEGWQPWAIDATPEQTEWIAKKSYTCTLSALTSAAAGMYGPRDEQKGRQNRRRRHPSIGQLRIASAELFGLLPSAAIMHVDGVTFKCFRPNGGMLFVWHDPAERVSITANSSTTYCAIVDGNSIGDCFPWLETAMQAAVKALQE